MKQHIKYYFYRNIMEYVKVFGVFIIGIIVSVIVVNNSNDIQKNELKSYIDNKIEYVKTGEKYNSNEVFINSLKSNIKEIGFLAFLSSTIIGIPFAYYSVCKKGFSIGYTIASIYATQNTKTAIIFICNSMLFHNIIYMISMFIVLVSGTNLMKSIFGKEKRDFKFEIVRYIIFVAIALMIVIISSLFEAYISTNLVYFFKKYL